MEVERFLQATHRTLQMEHASTKGPGISLECYVQYLAAYGTLIGPEPGVHYARNDELSRPVQKGGTYRSWRLTGLRIHAEYSLGKVTYRTCSPPSMIRVDKRGVPWTLASCNQSILVGSGEWIAAILAATTNDAPPSMAEANLGLIPVPIGFGIK